MPKGLRRHHGRGDLHFITFSCYERRPVLQTVRARNLFVKILAEVRQRYDFLLVGYVLMPDHVHLLISEPSKNSFHSGAGFETESFPGPSQEEAPEIRAATAITLRGLSNSAAQILAAPVLRFQCVESCEEERKIAVYACESGEERLGDGRQGLALE
jgi:hypothetical protein